MKPETVERLLQAVDELAQRIGEKNYDVTVEKIQRWAPIARFILDFFDIMQTLGSVKSAMMNRAMFASVDIVPVRSLLVGFSKSNKTGR